jgi:C4-dicarboxylate-specific signal transduction histidine kinase
LQWIDLNVVVADSLKLLHSEIIARKTRIEFTPLPSIFLVKASFIELQQVFINLIVNSLDALSGQGANVMELAPCICIRLLSTADQIILEVADNGPGIPPENLEHLFEPFFSTKSSGKGKGLGLGLSISRGIVERYGGKLIASPPEDGRGAVFRITFPPPVADAKKAACDQGVDGDTAQ